MSELKLIELAKIVPHPQNPRIGFREDVVEAIAATLNGSFPQKHSIHVRPTGKKYETISGHQRVEAARRKNLSKIWAWVENLSDDEAFMELVTSNNQGELSPLEIGIHALQAVPKEKGGSGKKGGLSEYARLIGKSKQYIVLLRDAAEVVQNRQLELTVFIDKAKQLAAIHKLPKECWEDACVWLSQNESSVADVEKKVSDVTTFLESWDTNEWPEYLPVSECASAIFAGTDPNNFSKLASLASKVLSEIKEEITDANDSDEIPEENKEGFKEELKSLRKEFTRWLIKNKGNGSWKIKEVQDKRIEISNRIMELKHSKPTTEINLILADPPWKYDFEESDNRQIENQYPSATVEEICEHLNSKWMSSISVAEDCVLFLWATAPKIREALQVMEEWGFEYKTHAIWDKQKIGMGYWFRGQHELLLVGVKGNVSPPPSTDRVSSVFSEKRGKHSAKPEAVYQWIEKTFPNYKKLEMYCREPRDGWKVVGNESKKKKEKSK